MPIAILVSARMRDAAYAASLRHVTTQVQGLARDLRRDRVIDGASLEMYNIDLIEVFATDGHVVFPVTEQIQGSTYEQVCSSPTSELVIGTGDADWALACVDGGAWRVIAGVEVDSDTRTQVLRIIFSFSALVAIITAVGVLRLLTPLASVSAALTRISQGDRGVTIPRTGLNEIDELIDRVNATARAVAQREDAYAGRIELVHQLSRVVAHEVRNPLQSIEFQTSLVAVEEDAAERKKLADGIAEEVRNLELVVRKLLRDGLKRGALPVSPVLTQIDAVVDQVLGLVRTAAAQRGCRLEFAERGGVAMPLDRAFFSRAVENLVLNSLQAVPTGAGRVAVATRRTGDILVLTVDDNGPGVDPNIQGRLLDERVTTRTGGSGIGLILVCGVAEAHHGYVEHGRSPLGGARFTVRLPIHPPQEADGGS
jgi:signal transduction histidine kinase